MNTPICTCQHRRYIIELDSEYNYPFHGPKPKHFCVSVRFNLSERVIKDVTTVVSKLTEVSTENFVQIIQVLESNAGEVNYLLTYEYVPFSIGLLANHQEKAEGGSDPQLPVSSSELFQICKELARLRIKPLPRAEDFGLMADNKVKFFLRPNFTIVDNITTSEQEEWFASQLFQQYHYVLTMGLEISKRFMDDNCMPSNLSCPKFQGEKNHDIAEKIKKLRHNIFKVQMKTNENKGVHHHYASSEKNNSDNSENYNSTAKDEGGFQEERLSSEKSQYFEDSLSCKQVRAQKKKRTASFQLDSKKPRSEHKYKKASWGEEASTIVDSDRASVLKQRISQALEKTQKTLKKYEKIRTSNVSRKRKY